MKIPTKDWNDILSFYISLKDEYDFKVEPMIALVSMVNNSSYKDFIHAYTSHSILCVGQYSELDEINALLKIEYFHKKGEIMFSYKGDNSFKYSWNKSFPETNIKSEFKYFLNEIQWLKGFAI